METSVTAFVNTAPLLNKYITLDTQCPVVHDPRLVPLYEREWETLQDAAKTSIPNPIVQDVAFDSSGRFLAILTTNEELHLWDFSSHPQCNAVFDLNQIANPSSLVPKSLRDVEKNRLIKKRLPQG